MAKISVAEDLLELARALERTTRCHRCSGKGKTVECRVKLCWTESYCQNPQHNKTYKCDECSGSGYKCTTKVRRLFRKHLPKKG